MNRDNNLGKWDAGPNGGTTGLGFGPDYTDDMSGKAIPISPSHTLTLISFLLSLSCLFFSYAIIPNTHYYSITFENDHL